MTTSAARLALPLLDVDRPKPKRRLPTLPVAALLDAQATLTAVERFAKQHDLADPLGRNNLYRELLPLQQPKPHEQYAFEVDLDACTGCKACVSACHTLNGLDEGESWRTVGLLQGGSLQAPAIQTVTTSCHHCLEPACLQGCPVQAYEKDPITGIVKHLDDQCIGCQYCTLMCPYDAPKFNKARGIVRKCDMCSDRLAHDEAPACAQACPNQAISIKLVDRETLVESSNARGFLPGAPVPEHTLPSTTYRTERPMPHNMLPADFYRTSPEHSHPPLVVMLTLTQLAVGAFGLTYAYENLLGLEPGSPVIQSIMALSLAFLALGASVFHLGRPTLAWRVFLGLRTSWLSREAVAFGLFAMLGSLYGATCIAPRMFGLARVVELAQVSQIARTCATIVGVLGVFFSVMVYVATRRAQWSASQTGIRFFGTMLSLGAASVLSVYVATGGIFDRISRGLLELILVVTVAKVAFESSVFVHYRQRHFSVLKRVALLMLGDLSKVTLARFALAGFGGILLPTLLLSGVVSGLSSLVCGSMFVALLASELLERYLFFRAAPASRMPGGIR
jgi:formate dehydrogenase iron-sulfur subunit